MNNRFKFRVWNIKHRLFCDQMTEMVINSNGTCYDNGVNVDYFKYNGFIVEQCTGLKDKNGNLIYENDLIIAPNNSHKLVIIRMENGVYGCKECRFNGVWEMNLYDLIKHYGVEIIGNIHEQAEQKEQQ